MRSRSLTAVVTPRRLVLGVLLVAGTVLRWQLVPIETSDYRAFLDPWYTHLAENGGFAGLRDSFSNYNTPYLVLLAALTYLPVPQLVGIKLLSILFDVALAGLVGKIIAAVRPSARWLPVIGAGAVWMLPTVVMNSSAWAQCDAIYATFCVASLYFLIRRKPWSAAAMFGLAFAFKLQAIFFLPVLVAVVIINRHRVRTLLAVPATFLAALLPALVAGRSLLSQLAVYPAQITNSSGAVGGAGALRGAGGGGLRGGGGGAMSSSSHSFTYNAPTPYAWLPADASTLWKSVGLAVAAAVAIGFAVWLLSRRRTLSAAEIVLLAATAVLVIPVLLPEMHERYFYLAEVLAVVACCLDRRFLIVAAGLQVASISTYVSYLDDLDTISLELAAVFALGAAVTAAMILVSQLREAAPASTVSADGHNQPRVVEPVGAGLGSVVGDPVAPRQA